MDFDTEELPDKFSNSLTFLKPYSPYIVALLLFSLVIFGYYYFYPRPATLTVNVSALDGGVINSSIEVFIADASGNPVGSSNGVAVATNGIAVFTNLPSNQPLTVSANAGPNYNSQSTQITLSSGSSTSVNLNLQVSNSLSFSAWNIPSSITSDCAGNFYVTLQNNASSPFSAQLVSSGDSAITSYVDVGSSQTIPSNSSTNFTISFKLPTNQQTTNNQLNLNLRVKGTNVQQSFPLTLLSNPQITLNPSIISITDTSSHVFPITLINSGSVPITGFNFGFYADPNLAAVCQSDGSGCFSVNLLSSQNLTAIPANSQITFELDDKGLSNLPAGTYLAQLQLTANCIENPGIVSNIQIQIPSTS